MRFYLFGPRFFGIRPGVSFQPSDLRTPRPPSTATYIYVIKGDHEKVKIGVTKSPETRLAQLQTGSPSRIDYAFVAPVSGDPYAVEALAHHMLNRYHVDGEWFDVSPELAIAAVTGAAAKLGQSLMAAPPEKPVHLWPVFLILWILISAVIIWWIESLQP